MMLNNDIKKIVRSLLVEYDRRSYDKQYENEYEKLKPGFIKYFNHIIDYYFENDELVNLYDKDEKRLLTYMKRSQELYYNFDINKFMNEFIPSYLWARHDKYVISDVFNLYFDYPVKYVTPAGMN